MNHKIKIISAAVAMIFCFSINAKAEATTSALGNQLKSFINNMQEQQAYDKLPKVSINAINQPLGVVMQNFSALTNYSITYDNNVNLNSPITVSLSNVSLPLALQNILDQADYYYSINNFKKIIKVKAFETAEFHLPASVLNDSDAKYTFSSSGSSGNSNSQGGGMGSSGSSSSGNSGSSSGGSIASSSNFSYKAQQTGKSAVSILTSQIKTMLSKNGTVNIDPMTGMLYVKDYPQYVKSVSKYVDNWIQSFSKQVYIQAYIVQVGLDNNNEWGINWNAILNRAFRIGGFNGGLGGNISTGSQATSVTANPTGVSSSPTTLTMGNQIASNTSAAASTISNLGGLILGAGMSTTSGDVIESILTALSAQGTTKVMSSPRIFLVNNQIGNIQSGTSYPYIQSVQSNFYGSTTASGNNQLSYNLSSVTAGVNLTVIPHVLDNNKINLTIMPVVTSITGWTNFNMNGTTVQEPVVSTQNEYTSLNVKSGQLIIIGGAQNTSNSITYDKIPLLGDIPILGWLFKSRAKNNQQSVMVIIMRVIVIDNHNEGALTKGKFIEQIKKNDKKEGNGL